jgi:hypothetical protein
MRIDVKYEFPFAAEDIYTMFKDRMMDYVGYCPNLTKIAIMDTEVVDDNITKMRVQWFGLGQIPQMIRSILKPEMISWEDWETWDKNALECRWVIKPYYFREFVKCEGAWKFNPIAENKCLATCKGVFEVRITKFPPFPDFLVKKASPLIEGMIGGYLEPNLKSVFKAVSSLKAADLKRDARSPKK